MRRRKVTVELFEEIRREYEFGNGTIAGVARRFGVHRRLVREALGSAIPAATPARGRIQPRVGPVAPFIDEILVVDQQAPRKQRHTAHRIYVRLREERPDVPSPNRRSAGTYDSRRHSGDCCAARRSCRNTTSMERKPGWTGTRRSQSWERSAGRSRSSRCEAWRMEVPSIAPITVPPSRPS